MILRLNGHAQQLPHTVFMGYALVFRILLAAGILKPRRPPGTRFRANRHGLIIGVAGEVDADVWQRSERLAGDAHLQDALVAHLLRGAR